MALTCKQSNFQWRFAGQHLDGPGHLVEGRYTGAALDQQERILQGPKKMLDVQLRASWIKHQLARKAGENPFR